MIYLKLMQMINIMTYLTIIVMKARKLILNVKVINNFYCFNFLENVKWYIVSQPKEIGYA